MEKKYTHGGIEYSIEEINKPQIRFVDLIDTPVMPFIKEGSLKSIDGAGEIYIKLPNWGDVKLSFYNHPITFKEVEDEKKEVIVDFRYLTTTLKVKVVDGDNSGYKKHYFIPLCWMQKDLFTKTGDIEKVVNLLLKNNSIKELEEDPNALYWDTLCAGGV